ncbi:MAG TPA: TIGR01777 family oxidoreductase [Candidatus Tumulicola sp.]
MRIVIAGGSGHLGSVLAEHWHARGSDVVVLSRRRCETPWKSVRWDGRTVNSWAHELEGADVIVNLAARSVNCRYTATNRRDILSSRIESTLALGEAIARLSNPPPTWLQASTATIYAHRFDAANDEATGVIGGKEVDAPNAWRFSIDVATAWETACLDAPAPQTRKVLLRSAIVMSTVRGGPFARLLDLVRLGLGGAAGNGRQYVSWIHETDFVRAVDFLIRHRELSGPVNVASPSPLPNAQFMANLRQAAGVLFGIPATKWMLEAGALVLGTETELLLKSRRVVPRRLLEAGFEFAFPQWPPAAVDLVERMPMVAAPSRSRDSMPSR